MADIDWPGWLRRWDAQQEGYVPEREARFTAMFDTLEALLPAEFVALDLASGPGSISGRLLRRFPGARAVAVDMDPVMLAVGEGALGTAGGRLRWVEADLAGPDWVTRLGETRFDAVLSSTAMHWLPPDPLRRVCRELAGLLRPEGLLLNADHLAFGPDLPTFARLGDRVLEKVWTDESFAARGIETAEQWWDAIGAEPELKPQLEARARLYASKERHEPPPFDFHVAALRDAGFREVGTIWQSFSDRILMAVR